MAKCIILDTILVEEFVVIKDGIRNLISLSVFLQKRVKGNKMQSDVSSGCLWVMSLRI